RPAWGGVEGARGGRARPGGWGPVQHAGGGLRQPPAGGLLGCVVTTAQRRQVAFAGTPAAMVRHGVVQVTTGSRAPAAGECTPVPTDPDQVLQRQRRPIGTGLPLVGTCTG